MSGEGIAQALEMGIAAGEAIAVRDSADDGGDVAAVYVDALKNLVTEQAVSSVASRVLTRRATAELVCSAVASTEPTRRAAARLIFDDATRARVAVPDAWVRLLRRRAAPGPGPYSTPLPLGAADSADRRVPPAR